MARKRRAYQPRKVETLTHDEAGRPNIPTAEYQALLKDDEQHPIKVAFERRNPDLDPQLVWRGKDPMDWSDLITTAPPLYIQEKVQPKALIDDLMRSGEWRVKSGEPGAGEAHAQGSFADLYADFNGLPQGAERTDFYQHQANWSNRMILGDSLHVMASLAEREGLRGQVQCIYFDPPYGIKFNSNFQWSTTSRDVRDGKREHITREPEQVKAFRDIWKDGIHSYLTYLRDRLTVARDLLAESGSVFVQIGNDNVHRVRALMDEVFGEGQFCGQIEFNKTGGFATRLLASVTDSIVWYSKNISVVKYRPIFDEKLPARDAGQYDWAEFPDGQVRRLTDADLSDYRRLPQGTKILAHQGMSSQGVGSEPPKPLELWGREFSCPTNSHWKTHGSGTERLLRSSRLFLSGRSFRYKRFLSDFPVLNKNNIWMDVGISGFSDKKLYVVQTNPKVVERCLLMTSDPGDLVLDPTCGSGTTAYVAEQWGRRWITIDTSRVALALARARIMGARYPYYLLADSTDGQAKQAEVERREPSSAPTYGDIRQGFVYERVPHITLRAIANNAEIDVIWERMQPAVEAALSDLNQILQTIHPVRVEGLGEGRAWQGATAPPFASPAGGREGQLIEFSAPGGATVTLPSGETAPVNALLEWEVPREPPEDWPAAAHEPLARFWEARIARQREIDASISAKADFEYLYDKPYEDRRTVRVAGPFTVESLSPHRILGVDEHGELIDTAAEETGRYGEPQDFASMILDNLRTAGVQQAHKDDRITFDSLTPWPGDHVCAEGRYAVASGQWPVVSEEGTGDGEDSSRTRTVDHGPPAASRRAGIFVGPEFGTVQRQDLVEAAREAAEAGFDLLIACAFNYEAHATEFDKLGRIPILKARMNADLHMAGDLKNTGQGNLFVIFGEPDIDVLDAGDNHVRVRVNGVDVFDPSAGEVRSDDTDGIACWFIDTDYDSESFFVRQAYFLGANDPYKSLKTTLRAEIDAEAWATLHSDTSRPFPKPASGRIAVKVINHLGDEVMKVFRVE